MPLSESTSEIIQVIVFTGGVDYFFIPQPVFITGDQAAAKSEIPGEEGIQIKNIHITVIGIAGFINGISILVNIGITVELDTAQVMTATEGEINSGREIINAAEYGSNICKINKSYNGFVIDFSSGINDIIRFPFMAMRQIKGKPVTESIAKSAFYSMIGFIGCRVKEIRNNCRITDI